MIIHAETITADHFMKIEGPGKPFAPSSVHYRLPMQTGDQLSYKFKEKFAEKLERAGLSYLGWSSNSRMGGDFLYFHKGKDGTDHFFWFEVPDAIHQSL